MPTSSMYNSINYSFIQNEKKKQLLKDLDSRFITFEANFL
jgi:adenosine deaminase/adenosine deaminase CECR1